MREYENLVCHLWPLTCSEAKLFAISQQGFNKISESVEEIESERLREALGLVGCVEVGRWEGMEEPGTPGGAVKQEGQGGGGSEGLQEETELAGLRGGETPGRS